MNDHMWEHPATQANVELLRARGVTVIEPGVGALGSKGEWGVGRLAEPADLLAAVEGARPPPARARRTACASSSPRAARASRSTRSATSATAPRAGWASRSPRRPRRSAPRSRSSPRTSRCRGDPAVRYVDVETAAELQAACDDEFAACDVLVMAAAVADFRPAAAADTKLKKNGRDKLTLELERTEDILSGLAAARRPGQTLVGFAAEHGEGAVAYGRDKLARKGLDAVVVNDIARPTSASTPPRTR